MMAVYFLYYINNINLKRRRCVLIYKTAGDGVQGTPSLPFCASHAACSKQPMIASRGQGSCIAAAH